MQFRRSALGVGLLVAHGKAVGSEKQLTDQRQPANLFADFEGCRIQIGENRRLFGDGQSPNTTALNAEVLRNRRDLYLSRKLERNAGLRGARLRVSGRRASHRRDVARARAWARLAKRSALASCTSRRLWHA